jgi:hypothetical protein
MSRHVPATYRLPAYAETVDPAIAALDVRLDRVETLFGLEYEPTLIDAWNRDGDVVQVGPAPKLAALAWDLVEERMPADRRHHGPYRCQLSPVVLVIPLTD